ncbi:hypothetical protein PTKIN_Ptkin02bG0223400 [Pterospermum kingtungense]
MILAIAISLLYVEIKDSVLRRILSQITKQFWSEWELRLMVIVSLALQFLLGYFGRKRKIYTGKWVPIIAISAWLIYLSADWMATLVLSTLLRGTSDLEYGLIVFWTPFLLWHLGGPYNITAYSLEDNDLWLRHFLGMVFQIGEAIYIYARFRSNTELNAMASPLFIGGVIKYGERIWALRCASPKQLINSFYTSSITCKNPDERTAIGGNMMKEMIRTGMYGVSKKKDYTGDPIISPEVKFLREVHSSFDIFKPLFSDLPFQISQEFHEEMVYLQSRPADEAFDFVGIELEFLYDFLYTKNPIHQRQHLLSLILHSICFVSVVSVLIAFSVLLRKIEHNKVDITITYLLLFGAIYQEMYSFYKHFWSKWTMLGHAIPRNSHLQKLYRRFADYRLGSVKFKKGIKQIAQHDLIDYIVKAKGSQFTPVIELIDTANLLQRFWHSKWKPIDTELKEFIYSHLQKKRSKYDQKVNKLKYLDKLLGEKGDNVIEEKLGYVAEDEDWDMESTDFTRRVFIWHIATALVYYHDIHKHRIGTCSPFIRIGKSLSDYMMYLVLVRPTMLPNGFSDTVNKETLREAERFFPQARRGKDLKLSMEEFVAALLQMSNESIRLFSQPGAGVGALDDGVKLAQQLQSLVSSCRWDIEEKWEMMSEVWMDMMVYAASRCKWEEHAQQLKHGGELLTHVSLLMAHLGLSTQIHRLKQISP